MADDTQEKRTARFQTAGGWFVELDLPLSKLMKEQYDRGELVEVDDDGNVIPEGDRTPVEPQEASGSDEQGARRTNVVAPRPTLDKPAKSGKGSSVEAWRAYALSVDSDLTQVDAEAMSRDDLIEKYGDA